jgi:hypothetical protein
METLEGGATAAIARGVSSYEAEAAEIARIDRLEPSLLPGAAPIGPVTTPTPRDDDRLQTPAYLAGARVLRVSLAEDYADVSAEVEGIEMPPPAAWGAAGATPIEPHLAFMATPAPSDPIAPASRAARAQVPVRAVWKLLPWNKGREPTCEIDIAYLDDDFRIARDIGGGLTQALHNGGRCAGGQNQTAFGCHLHRKAQFDQGGHILPEAAARGTAL